MESPTTLALPSRPDVIASDSVRERFHVVDGMRALAVVSLAFYELVNVFPALFRSAGAATAARQSIHGFDVLALLAGYALAYPAFAVARQDGAAAFDLARFAIKRIVRVLPAYLTVVVLTLLIPVLAHRAGFAPAAHASGAFPTWRDAIAALGTTASVPLGNDAIWGAGAIARFYVVLPLLLVVWLRFPIGVWLVAIAAASADLLLPSAHTLGAGALAAFSLGVIAADLRAQGNPLQRFGLPVFALAAVAGFFANATFTEFAGSTGAGAPTGYVENPMWQLAFFGLLAAAGASANVERAFGGALFAFLSSASFGIALVCEPVIAFIVHATAASLSAPIAALNAFLMAVAAGIGLWAAVDRWFADGPARNLAAERLGRALAVVLRPIRLDRIVLRPPGRPALLVDDADANAPAGFYAPPPRPEATDVASVKRRIGSADDLAAEIRATKHRLAEQSAALFAEPEPEKPKPVFKKPGFHGPGFARIEQAPPLDASPGATATPIVDPVVIGGVPPARPQNVVPSGPVPPAGAVDDDDDEPPQAESRPAPRPATVRPAGSSPIGVTIQPARPTPAAGAEPVLSQPAAPPDPTSQRDAPNSAAPHIDAPHVDASQTDASQTDASQTGASQTVASHDVAPAAPPHGETPAKIDATGLPPLDLPNVSLARPAFDAQRFIAELDTLPTGDGSFDSAGAREFADQTLGERPIALDLPVTPSDPDALDEAVEAEERDEPPQPTPPRRVNLTLRPDRPISVHLSPEPGDEHRNGSTEPRSTNP